MNVTIPMKDHKIIVEKARHDAYHEGYKQGRFDEFIESQYGREDHDIIPVIRCKDCKYSTDEYGDGDCYCDLSVKYIGKDWNHFCSWAERRTDETD